MSEQQPIPRPPPIELYRIVREEIEFEDSLITQRLSWFVAAQSFLFSAYAITLNAPQMPGHPGFREQTVLVYHLIPVVAIASCALIYFTILAGVIAQIQLRRFARRSITVEESAMFPLIQGAVKTRVMGLAAPLGLPLVFVSVWIYLFVRGVA